MTRLFIHREKVPDPAGLINWTSAAFREQIRNGNCFHVKSPSQTQLPVTNVLIKRGSKWCLPPKSRKLARYHKVRSPGKRGKRQTQTNNRFRNTISSLFESDIDKVAYAEVCRGSDRHKRRFDIGVLFRFPAKPSVTVVYVQP